MKTPFLRTRRRNTLLAPGSGKWILAAIVLVVLLFILRTFFPGMIATLATPFWSAGSAATNTTGSIAAFFGDKAVLAQERDTLMREVATLKEQNAILTARTVDIERLLGGRTEASPGILAGVLARPPVSPYDTLVIDQGEASGVVVGKRVMGAGGIPLGVIESVGSNSARVLLYSAPGRVTEGWVGVSRTPVSLEGASAGAFRTSVPRERIVAVGEEVYLPGPGALPIGTVVRVDTDPSSPRAVIHVRPRTSPFALTWVTVEE
jgi:cell shape-determining protein MreC